MTDPPRTAPGVLDRVVGLLRAFAPDRRSLTLTELARRAGLPLSTTHRMAADLTRHGLLERDRDGRFHLGLRLFELASLARAPLDLRDTALPFLEDLYEATHENVQLAVREGADAVFLERLAGRRSVHTLTRVGGRLPLHITGVGLTLLAHAPRAEQEAVLRAPLQRYTAHTVTDPARLRVILAAVRRDGYVISDRQVEDISVSIAAPVRSGVGGEVVAALSIVIAHGRADPARFVPAVVAAARGISRLLPE
jgi:DNA-binding IclR family transcriptional regulator